MTALFVKQQETSSSNLRARYLLTDGDSCYQQTDIYDQPMSKWRKQTPVWLWSFVLSTWSIFVIFKTTLSFTSSAEPVCSKNRRVQPRSESHFPQGRETLEIFGPETHSSDAKIYHSQDHVDKTLELNGWPRKTLTLSTERDFSIKTAIESKRSITMNTLFAEQQNDFTDRSIIFRLLALPGKIENRRINLQGRRKLCPVAGIERLVPEDSTAQAERN